ncbi:hypothetical protein GR294_13735 [Raoultella sp. Lac2]|jgi:hypothetical protein|uniref:Uncharacterized protein n=1 Tax=Klebsiella electrica TaxID=1259973 RepID=A0AAJ5UC86_9ENTR|nr:hypothetical protein [Klebsiella electrica]MXF47584.1 hypothetical protein [Raoultella sp. Lac2]MXF98161.1 hypothetical protein [Raoultella sp. Lac1]WBW59331.1 hypothetical protein OR613_14900 [Klebsiella electrica]WIO45102.1 hypothetical protein P2G42_11015 [Klebsiella electrica]
MGLPIVMLQRGLRIDIYQKPEGMVLFQALPGIFMRCMADNETWYLFIATFSSWLFVRRRLQRK